MNDCLTLVQFGSPWQGASGFEKIKVDAVTGDVLETSRVKCQKVIHKTTKKIDGIIMKPTWPTRRRLCLIVHENDITFHELVGDKMDLSEKVLSYNDDSFQMEAKEYFLFRKFVFSTRKASLAFFDFSNRLISPERTIMRHDLESHFSALARLIDIMKHEDRRHQFLKDLKKHRFKYRKYFEDKKRAWDWANNGRQA